MDSVVDMSLNLDCHRWMDELWDDLSAQTEAYDDFVNSTHATIVCEHIDKLEPELQARLSTKKCTVAKLFGSRPELSRRTRHYQQRLLWVREDALPTIAEDERVEDERVAAEVDRPGGPAEPGLVDPKIGACVRTIRQSLRSYRPTGTPGTRRRGPTRADLQSLGEEFGVMANATTKIVKYRRLLDGCEVDPSFRPRVAEIVAFLEYHRDNQFRFELEVDDLNRLDGEIQDHLRLRAEGASSSRWQTRAPSD
ncbi:hypothetical protein MMC29_001231 [Sticta canariensis]|nr:hypothetical protein [Sticta canariensis]